MNSSQIPILLYHRIVNTQSKIGKHKIYVWEKNFRKQMKFLKENSYKTVTFKELSQLSNHLTIQPSVILTFDDGYEDNYTILFPILKEFNFTAVIFLVTKLSCNEWAIREGEPQLKILDREMIREMSEYGIEFGGHTQTHPDFTKIPVTEAKKEIKECKRDIEEITGKPCICFAYPFGVYNEEILQATKNVGFQFGITTIFGPKNLDEDKMRIRRIEVRPRTTLFSFKRKASGRYFEKSIFNLFSGK